jgi:hypothetical protein
MLDINWLINDGRARRVLGTPENKRLSGRTRSAGEA